jgi:hypothetical protein
MKLFSGRMRVLAALVASSGAVTALVLSGSGPASAVSSAASPVVTLNCSGKAQVKPSQFILTCADAGDSLASLRWVSWRGVAFGTGTEVINDCFPNCADGKFYRFPVLVTLWRAVAWRGHRGRLYFSRLTEIHAGTRTLPHNRALPVAQTWILSADGG